LIEGILSLDMNIEELSRNDDEMTNKIEWSMGDVFWLADEETCIKELLVDREYEKWELMDRESLIYDLNRVLRKLGGRKRKILEMYYGLNWYKEHTFQEIAKYYNLTHQRIQQEKRTAISIIRDDIQPELLRKYL
jgi:RNA polymerase sigma factor (sigma-70 family)